MWHEFANAGIDKDKYRVWLVHGNSDLPANIKEDSETPWLAFEAIKLWKRKKRRRAVDVSYELHQTHWPYIVPAPYHNMYGGMVL